MKTNLNQSAITNYCELLDQDNSLNQGHPAVLRMQELSSQVPVKTATAITRLEVHKECHRLADDLYRLTGSKRMFTHVLRIGNLLLNRIFNENGHSMHNQQ